MAEIHADLPALRLSRSPAVALAAVVGAGVTAAALARPSFGLYLADGVALVASVTVAGLGFFTALLGDPTDGQAWWGRFARGLAVAGFAAALLTVAFSVMVVAGTGLSGLADSTSREAVLRGPGYEGALTRCGGLLALAAAFSTTAMPARWRRLLMIGGGLVVAASFLLVGHARSHGPAAVVSACLLAHVVGVSGWAGGLLGLGVSSRRRVDASGRRARVLVTFAGLMTGVITMLLAGGLGLAFLYVPSWHALVTTAYGQVLIVKSGLVAAMLVVSTSNHFRLVPQAARGDARALSVLRMNLAVEQIGLVTVLLVTEILLRQNPVGS